MNLTRIVSGRRSSSVLACIILSLIFLTEILAIYATTGHPVFFTLDDPYIHLALAENIARGTYGINDGESASPSSSILYPFLLAPLAGTVLGSAWALTLNLAASFGVLFLWRQIAIRFGFDGDHWQTNMLALLATLAVNGGALPFTGMEHMPHVFFTLAIALAIIDVAEGKPTPWFLIPAAFAGALLRYEGGVVAGAAGLVLLLSGRWRETLLLGLLVAAAYVAFSSFLHSLGLPILPSSVLVKSSFLHALNMFFMPEAAHVAESASKAISGAVEPTRRASFMMRVVGKFSFVDVLLVVCLIFEAVLIYVSTRMRPSGQASWAKYKVGIFALCVIAAHLVVFRSGWFYRYEPYAVSVVLVSLGYALFVGETKVATAWKENWKIYLGGSVLLLTFAFYYAGALIKTPLAARNIYSQQYQMHRFVTSFWRAPVAVNDLGWVAYKNPDYVLDLLGLGSDKARRAYSERDRVWFERKPLEMNVGMAVIYKSFFPGFLPEQWSELAVLSAEGPRITVASAKVSFFLIDPAMRERAETALRDFAATLPPGVSLEILPTIPATTD